MHNNMNCVIERKHKSELLSIFLLLVISVVINIYIAATTEFISKDGVTFITFARQLSIDPQEVILNQDQHPGYPFLINICHSILSPLLSSGLTGWIFCAICVSVFFKTMTVLVLYFWGKSIADAKTSFVSLLLFLFLPLPARIASDALSDWPNLFALACGMLCLYHAICKNRLWLYGLCGIMAGLGYLVRPETGQLVVYSLCMILFLCISRRISLGTAVLTGLAVCVVFLIIVLPYMNMKGSLFPKKDLDNSVIHQAKTPSNDSDHQSNPKKPGISFSNIPKSIGELLKNLGETGMWFISFFWVMGSFVWFKQTARQSDKVLLMLFMSLNIVLMVLLYTLFEYMSYRHTLPLFAITFPFIGLGIREFANWLQNKYSSCHPQTVSLVIMIIGISICVPKLVLSFRTDKLFYRDVIAWVKENIPDNETISVFDSRIGFYAQKSWIPQYKEKIDGTDWFIREYKTSQPMEDWKENQQEHLVFVKSFEGGKKLAAVFRNLNTTPADNK